MEMSGVPEGLGCRAGMNALFGPGRYLDTEKVRWVDI